MPMQTVNSSGLVAEIRDYYDKVMLYTARPELIHQKYGKASKIPKGMGKTIHWRRYVLLSPATTPLTEGVTPPSDTMVIQEVVVTVNQYGNWVPFSDVVTVTSIDDIMTVNAEQLGQNSGNTLDILARQALNSGNNVRYANGRISRATVAAGDVITDIEIKKLRRQLAAANAKPATGRYFVAIVHPNTTTDLQATDGFLLPGFYQNQGQIEDGEVGRLYGVQFMETTNAQIFPGAGAAGIDVYSTVCFGRDAFAYVDIQSLGLETIYKALGSAGTEDALNQRQTQGWKATYVAKILNDAFLTRLEHATTA